MSCKPSSNSLSTRTYFGFDVQINDDGQGIHPDELRHIFERFYRAEKSRSKMIDYDQKGFGLGLAIANLIMERHRGRIEVKSELGVGSTFSMCLPVAEKGND